MIKLLLIVFKFNISYYKISPLSFYSDNYYFNDSDNSSALVLSISYYSHFTYALNNSSSFNFNTPLN